MPLDTMRQFKPALGSNNKGRQWMGGSAASLRLISLAHALSR